MKRLCSIDLSLKEKIDLKELYKCIDEEIALVKFNLIRRRFRRGGLTRKNLEKTHILIINRPTTRLLREEFIELIDYIDVGGTLILNLPPPKYIQDLGRWFEAFIDELGISLTHEVYYGIPKISKETRLVGNNLSSHKAFEISCNNDSNFMKENGIKKYIPLAFIDDKPIIVFAEKRRGRFIVFCSSDTLKPENKNFISILLRLASQRRNFLLEEPDKIKIGSSNFSISLQHTSLSYYSVTIYHHDFAFFSDVMPINSLDDFAIEVYKEIEKQQILSSPPTIEELFKTLKNIELEKG
ncbi:MAG: hypothetical protein ACTSRR_03810 [Candidatus Heimdallarchaeaceae archaeon]